MNTIISRLKKISQSVSKAVGLEVEVCFSGRNEIMVSYAGESYDVNSKIIEYFKKFAYLDIDTEEGTTALFFQINS